MGLTERGFHGLQGGLLQREGNCSGGGVIITSGVDAAFPPSSDAVRHADRSCAGAADEPGVLAARSDLKSGPGISAERNLDDRPGRQANAAMLHAYSCIAPHLLGMGKVASGHLQDDLAGNHCSH